MSLSNELMAQGMQSGLANQLGFDVPALTVSAAGNSQATATQLVADANIVTTVGSGSGVILPNRPGEVVVTNAGGSNALLVYPPVGSTFAGSALNASRSVSNGQTLWAVTAGTTIFATVG